MKKELFYKSLIFLVAFLLISKLVLNVYESGNVCRNFSGADSKPNSRPCKILLEEFNIAPTKGVILKRAAFIGGKDRTLCTKFIIAKSLIDKFKRNLRFSTSEVKLSSYPYYLLPAWKKFAIISKTEIDHIEKNEENKIEIIYMKEQNGEIVIFIFKWAREGMSRDLFALFDKKYWLF